MKRISDDIRAAIVKHALYGISTRAIAHQFGVSVGSVSNIIRASNCNIPNNVYGRPRKLTSRDERKIVRWISSGSCSTAVEASRRLREERKNQLFCVQREEGFE
jgi:transposase